MTTTITQKGQVTLPKQVRDAVGLKPGDEVEVRATASGGVYIEKPGKRDAYRARLYALAERRPIRGITTDDDGDAPRRGRKLQPEEELTIADINVLLDVLTRDPAWLDWSAEQLDRQAAHWPIIVNEAIYAELSAGFANEADV